MSKAIGIDLRDNHPRVGVWQHDRVKIIANNPGQPHHPILDTERVSFDAAKNKVAMNPVNTVFDAKCLIGRKSDDPEVQADMRHFPFKVISNNGKPNVQVEYGGETKTLLP